MLQSLPLRGGKSTKIHILWSYCKYFYFLFFFSLQCNNNIKHVTHDIEDPYTCIMRNFCAEHPIKLFQTSIESGIAINC